MYMRKTVRVDWLRELLNDHIAREHSLEARKALCFVLSDILMEADRYRGFSYRGGWKAGYYVQHTDGSMTYIPGQEDEYDHVYY